MRPASFIGFFTAAIFNPWLVGHFIPAKEMATAQFWLIAGIDVALIIWSVLLLKKQSASTGQNLLLSVCVSLWFGFGLSMADHFFGPRVLEHKKNLVYGAFDRARMFSTEFDISYQMNNLGFRGPITKIEKDERERIVFIGDSFTFGWGVEEEDAWVGKLRKNHPDKEILNLGRGGDHPMDHVQRVRRVAPILKPDKVVVCLLAWNDLFQIKRVLDYERGTHESTIEKPKVNQTEPPLLYRTYRHLFPNFSSVFQSEANLNQRWRDETEWILSQLGDSLKNRYNGIGEDVRRVFENYQLNPWIVYEGVFHGSSYLQACSGEMDEALVRISHHLLEFEELAHRHSFKLEFLVLPYRPTNCPGCMEDLIGLGYQFEPENRCLTDSIIEAPLRDLISTPIHYFDSRLYNPNEVQEWYFRLDGHLNKKGNEVVAFWADTVLFQ